MLRWLWPTESKTEDAPANNKGIIETLGVLNKVLHICDELQSNPRTQRINDDIQKANEAIKEFQKIFINTNKDDAGDIELKADGSIAGFTHILVAGSTKLTNLINALGKFDGSRAINYLYPSTYTDYVSGALTEAEEFLKLLPIMFEAYQKLGVSKFLHEQELTLQGFKQVAAQMVSPTLQSSLEMFLRQVSHGGALQALSFSNDEATLAAFTRLATKTPVAANTLMLAMQEINDAMCRVMLYLDDFESRYGIKTGTVLKSLPLSLKFEPNSPLAQSGFNDLDLEQLCILWRDAYKERMKILGFPIEHDLYPYKITLYHHRLAHLKQLQDEATFTNVSAFAERALEGIRIDLDNLQRHLETKLVTIQSHTINGLDTPAGRALLKSTELVDEIRQLTLEAAVKRVQELLQNRPEKKYWLETRAEQLLGTEDSYEETYWETVEQLDKIYANALNRHAKWEEEAQTTITQLAKKIDDFVRADLEDNSISDEQKLIKSRPFPRIQRYDSLSDTLNATVAEAKGYIKDLFPQNAPDSAAPGLAPRGFAFIKDKLVTTEAYLKTVIDEDLYNRITEGNISENLPAKELVLAIKAAKEGVIFLDQLSAEVGLGQSLMVTAGEAATPSEALTITSKNAHGIVKASRALTSAIMHIMADPLTQEYTETATVKFNAVKAKSKELLGKSEATVTEAADKSSQEQAAAEKRNPLLKKISDAYTKFKNKPQITEPEKQAIERVIKNTETIWKEVWPVVKVEPSSLRKIIHILTTSLTELIELKNDLMVALNALQKVSTESVIMILEQLHRQLKSTYLALDKAEVQLGLKDGTLTTRLSIQGQSIVSLIQQYEKLADTFDFPLKFDDRCPYPRSVLIQRRAIANNIPPATDPIKFNLACARYQQKLTQIRSDEENFISALKDNSPKTHAMSLIDRRISELKSELPKSYFFTRRLKSLKISLLATLKEGLKNKSYDEMIKSLKSHKGYQRYIHRILDGRTAVLLDNIQTGKLTSTEMEKHITLLMHSLSQQLDSSFFLFSSRKNISERIFALSTLKNHIGDLSNLPAKHAEVLMKYESTVFNKVKIWENIRKERDELVTQLTINNEVREKPRAVIR